MIKWQDFIISDKNILSGKPIIKGTRISVEFIVNLLAQGWKVDEILENYPNLSEESIKAIFSYLSDCLKDEKIFDFKKVV